MAELRLVGVSEDGQSLLLADESGDQHTISIDERLRAGVNGHLSRLGQLTMALESRISPREIQERVRAGESAEHVAITAGVPLERVLRFVGPVLREREHVADQARRARLSGSNGPSSLLADVVARAAARQGADPEDVSWDSARREDHSWVVLLTWPDGSTATWALDVMRHQATPLDAPARAISGLAEPQPQTGYPDFDPEAGFDARFDAAFDDPFGHGPDVGDGPTDSDDAGSARDDRHNVRAFTPRAVAPTLYDEAKDQEHAEHQAEGGPAGRAGRDADEDAERPQRSDETTAAGPAAAARDDSGTAKQPSSAARPSRSSRRARVPKWDDIMFGPKSKD
jgi:hypothetical protein